jgi:transcriptional regulator with XRE-family HTH domain
MGRYSFVLTGIKGAMEEIFGSSAHEAGRKMSRHRAKQESFADAVGLHRTYIGGIERGERNVCLRNLLRIADTLEIPLSQLLAKAENSLEESIEE